MISFAHACRWMNVRISRSAFCTAAHRLPWRKHLAAPLHFIVSIRLVIKQSELKSMRTMCDRYAVVGVMGTTKPIHRGRTTQLWEIRITDEADKLVCIARITVAVLEKSPAATT